MSPQLPRNAYTHAPEQQLDLILGSLKLLFWLFFLPSAWRNYIVHIDPALHPDCDRVRYLQWWNPVLWRLLIQAYLLLPLLVNIAFIVLFWGLGESSEKIAVRVTWGMTGAITGCLVGCLLWSAAWGVAIGVVWGTAWGVVWSITWGIAGWIQWNTTETVVRAMPWGIVLSLAFSATEALTWGIRRGTALNIAVGLVEGIVFFVTVSPLVRLSVGLALGIALGVGLTFNLWRPAVIYPLQVAWNFLIYCAEKIFSNGRFTLLLYHSAFWDEFQYIPLVGLKDHILLVAEYNLAEVRTAIDYLNTSPQKWAAQAAQIELDARRLENCADLQAIRKAHQSLVATGELEGSGSAMLRNFSRISEDVNAALNQQSFYNQREALNAVANHLDGLLQELTRSSNKYVVRFRPITICWQWIITNHVHKLTTEVELRQEIDDPYIFGNPLDHYIEVFMGRTSIGIRIENLILDQRHSPLLLYGQRRMGKTSLLNNLGRLLPNSIIPMFVDLQGPAGLASDQAGFLYNLARGMSESAKHQSSFTLPSLSREDLATDAFTQFDEWLDKVEQTLDQNTALLALDEFEALDRAITKGCFDEENVLGMLRHLIQHRPRFKVLLAGSHTLEEFQRWASYLINVQVLHISYLTETEARQLIEHPIKEFTLRYEPDAVQRVLNLTRCHPCLVQLLCSEIVALKNEQDPSVRRLATVADVEAAVPEALSTGSFFFADIQNNQIDALGLAILRHIAARGEGATVPRKTIVQQFSDCNSTLNLLLQRELIEEIDNSYRFQVELIRRWFA